MPRKNKLDNKSLSKKKIIVSDKFITKEQFLLKDDEIKKQNKSIDSNKAILKTELNKKSNFINAQNTFAKKTIKTDDFSDIYITKEEFLKSKKELDKVLDLSSAILEKVSKLVETNLKTDKALTEVNALLNNSLTKEIALFEDTQINNQIATDNSYEINKVLEVSKTILTKLTKLVDTKLETDKTLSLVNSFLTKEIATLNHQKSEQKNNTNNLVKSNMSLDSSKAILQETKELLETKQKIAKNIAFDYTFLNNSLDKEEFLYQKQKNKDNQKNSLDSQNSKFNLENKSKGTKKEIQHDEDKKIIEIKNLTKYYKGKKSAAVKNISFAIYRKQFHALIGANGAGKTTTIKAIIGAYSPYHYKGKIFVDSLSNFDVKSKSKIGYVPEKALFPKNMTTYDYLTSMAALSGYSIANSKKISIRLLKTLGMSEFLKKKPYNFSSGQKKKILLAQALIHNPDVLVLDEPAANLDPKARHELFSILVKLQNKGKAIFISSHILDEIGKYATFATILDNGSIIYNDFIKDSESLSILYQKHVINKNLE